MAVLLATGSGRDQSEGHDFKSSERDLDRAANEPRVLARHDLSVVRVDSVGRDASVTGSPHPGEEVKIRFDARVCSHTRSSCRHARSRSSVSSHVMTPAGSGGIRSFQSSRLPVSISIRKTFPGSSRGRETKR